MRREADQDSIRVFALTFDGLSEGYGVFRSDGGWEVSRK